MQRPGRAPGGPFRTVLPVLNFLPSLCKYINSFLKLLNLLSFLGRLTTTSLGNSCPPGKLWRRPPPLCTTARHSRSPRAASQSFPCYGAAVAGAALKESHPRPSRAQREVPTPSSGPRCRVLSGLPGCRGPGPAPTSRAPSAEPQCPPTARMSLC